MIELKATGKIIQAPRYSLSKQGNAFCKWVLEIPPARPGLYSKRLWCVAFGHAAETAKSIPVNAVVTLTGEPKAVAYVDKLQKASALLEMVVRSIKVESEPAQAVETDVGFFDEEIPF